MTEPSSEVIEAVARAIEAARHNYEPQDWEPSERDLKVARAAIAAHTSALEKEVERLREALRLFTHSAYPVSTEINPRGHNWSEAYLDAALANAVALQPTDPIVQSKEL